MTDLALLKKKSQKIRSMAHHIQSGHRSLSKTFEALNLRIFEDSPKLAGSDVEEIILRVMENDDFILLQDLFCAVNRMRLCKLLTPGDVRSHVERMQEKGICKMVDIYGVETIFTNTSACFLNTVARAVAEAPITPYQLAETRKITLLQAEYQLLYAELEGVVTRDDETYRVTYYHNPFLQQTRVT
ncbi:Vacuolar -sorting-associated 36 [Babesia ovata]|uniref:Vacuolar-sorting-associated 36 n=1 Tax=Babesia ovata TaxID=189622 RepID=A0A2H6KC83_9APIC|nr:Vacuolar -sorting-associated 36 [Babesia ovata]GBE60597.1 Vacuolar -sorting-associated 36 [Babesia ovata]